MNPSRYRVSHGIVGSGLFTGPLLHASFQSSSGITTWGYIRASLGGERDITLMYKSHLGTWYFTRRGESRHSNPSFTADQFED